MGTQKNGKYKYANTRVVFELMHATKVSCNVGFIGYTNMLYYAILYYDVIKT